jgi:hypothetical protein
MNKRNKDGTFNKDYLKELWETNPPIERGVDFEKFESMTPEAVYLLGFIWADGYVKKHKDDGKKRGHIIQLSIAEEGYLDIKHIFDAVGHWYTWNKGKKKKAHHKQIVLIRTKNKFLHQFLVECDFCDKSIVGADKILEKIPNELHYLFYRGLFDGDGCWHIGENHRSCTFAGHSQHDWGYLAHQLDDLKLKHSIRVNKIGDGGSSYVDIKDRWGMIKFGRYLYQDNLHLCMSRKKAKFDKILESHIQSSQTKTIVCDETGEIYERLVDMAEVYGISYKAIFAHLSGANKTCRGKVWRLATEEERRGFIMRKYEDCLNLQEGLVKRSSQHHCTPRDANESPKICGQCGKFCKKEMRVTHD